MYFEAVVDCVIDGHRFGAGDQFEAGRIGRGFLKSAMNRRMIREIDSIDSDSEPHVLRASDIQSAAPGGSVPTDIADQFAQVPTGDAQLPGAGEQTSVPTANPEAPVAGDKTPVPSVDAQAPGSGDQGKADENRNVRKRSG